MSTFEERLAARRAKRKQQRETDELIYETVDKLEIHNIIVDTLKTFNFKHIRVKTSLINPETYTHDGDVVMRNYKHSEWLDYESRFLTNVYVTVLHRLNEMTRKIEFMIQCEFYHKGHWMSKEYTTTGIDKLRARLNFALTKVDSYSEFAFLHIDKVW